MQEETRLNFYSGGKFYIYGDIDETIPENIIAPLFNEIKNRSNQTNPEPIQVVINSYGGRIDYAFDIISLFDLAKEVGVQVVTIVMSTACSAASLIALCGHERVVSERAFHLLHFARGFDYADSPEMSKRNHENYTFINKQIVKLYEEKTKIKDIEKKLLSDNFMINGGRDLIKQGLADKII